MATKKHIIHQWEFPKVFHKYLMKDPSDIEMANETTSSHFTTLPGVHHINERKPGKDTNGHPYKPNSATELPTHEPLPDKENSKPLLADWEDEQPTNAIQYSETDEGRLEQDNKTDECHESNTQEVEEYGFKTFVNNFVDGDTKAGGVQFCHEMILADSNDVETGDDGLKSQIMNNESRSFVGNTYQHKKNLAQGMMDLALLSANANQLRYVMESAATHPYHYPSLTLISLSIVLQIAVGIGLIINTVKHDKDIHQADKINNMTVLGVFIITVVNVFTTSFSVATPTTIVPGYQVLQNG